MTSTFITNMFWILLKDTALERLTKYGKRQRFGEKNAKTPKQKPPQATTTAEESEIQFNIDDEDKEGLSDSDEDFVPNDSPSKKTKYEYIQVLDDENIPKEMRNLRLTESSSTWSVYLFEGKVCIYSSMLQISFYISLLHDIPQTEIV